MTKLPQAKADVPVRSKELPEGLRNELDELAKSLGDSARILVRPSGTEPKIRIMVEGDDADPLFSQCGQNLRATCRAQVRREKTAVPDDESQRRWSFGHDGPSRYHAARPSGSAP